MLSLLPILLSFNRHRESINFSPPNRVARRLRVFDSPPSHLIIAAEAQETGVKLEIAPASYYPEFIREIAVWNIVDLGNRWIATSTSLYPLTDQMGRLLRLFSDKKSLLITEASQSAATSPPERKPADFNVRVLDALRTPSLQRLVTFDTHADGTSQRRRDNFLGKVDVTVGNFFEVGRSEKERSFDVKLSFTGSDSSGSVGADQRRIVQITEKAFRDFFEVDKQSRHSEQRVKRGKGLSLLSALATNADRMYGGDAIGRVYGKSIPRHELDFSELREMSQRIDFAKFNVVCEVGPFCGSNPVEVRMRVDIQPLDNNHVRIKTDQRNFDELEPLTRLSTLSWNSDGSAFWGFGQREGERWEALKPEHKGLGYISHPDYKPDISDWNDRTLLDALTKPGFEMESFTLKPEQVCDFFGTAGEWSSIVRKGRTLGDSRWFDSRLDPSCKPELPSGVSDKLFPFQVEGASWLLNLSQAGVGGILADEMGLGKTAQTLTFLQAQRILLGDNYSGAVVVVPSSVRDFWLIEAKQFTPHLKVALLEVGALPNSVDEYWGELARVTKSLQNIEQQRARHDVLVVTYKGFEDWAKLRGIQENYRDYTEEVFFRVCKTVVFDEFPYKDPDSKGYKAASCFEAHNKFVLTGTPISRSLGDLSTLANLVNPGLMLKDSFDDDLHLRLSGIGEDPRIVDIATRVSSFILRRTREEVLPEVKPPREIIIPVTLHERHREIYDALTDKLFDELKSSEEVTPIAVLRVLTQLRSCANDLRTCSGTIEGARDVRSAKFDAVLELVRRLNREGDCTNTGTKVLICSGSNPMLALIAQELKKEAAPLWALNGEVATGSRHDIVDQFNRHVGPANFLANYNSAGRGISLPTAGAVIHIDVDLSPDVMQQMSARAVRIGQKGEVTVYAFVTQDTVESRAAPIFAERVKSFREMMSGVLKAPGVVSIEDLLWIISPKDAYSGLNIRQSTRSEQDFFHDDDQGTAVPPQVLTEEPIEGHEQEVPF